MKKIILPLAALITINIYSQDFWQQVQGPFGGLIAEVTVNPANQTLFAGAYGSGIYRSTDNAGTWHRSSNGFINPVFDDGTITFGFSQSGHIFSSAYTKGIYISTNNGDSWQQTGMTNGIITAICVTQNGSILAFNRGSSSIRRSTDNGQTWNTITAGLPAQVYINAFAVNQSSGNVYAAGHSLGDTSVFRSTDNGSTWQPLSLTGANLRSVSLNPSGYIFAGGQFGAYRSTNAGSTWQQVNAGIPGGRVNHIYCSSGSIILASTDSGLFRSSSNGSSWLYTGFSGKRTLSAMILSNGSYLCDVSSEGIYKSTNAGSTWQLSSTGINAMGIGGCAFGQSGISITCTDEGIYRSTDNANSWIKAVSGLSGKNFNALLYTTSSNFVCSGDSGIFRSTNNGLNWIRVSGLRASVLVYSPSNGYLYGCGRNFIGGVWRSVNGGANWEIINFEISPDVLCVNSSGQIFAGTSGGGVYKSTNNGVNWAQLSLNSGSVRSIGAAPNGYVYASVNGSFPNPSGIFRSTNGGANWQHMGFNFATYTIAVNSAGYIYTGSFGAGMFRSTNHGLSWDTINTGLINRVVTSLTFNPAGFLFAGTFYGGLFKSVSSTIGISIISNEVPKQYGLYQNYPNPFNPVTKINFSIPKNALVTLKIYDVLGREVAELINKGMTAGYYTVDYDASALPSGVYFYKISSGDFIDTKKMMLVK